MRLWCLWPVRDSFEEPQEPYVRGQRVMPVLVTVLETGSSVDNAGIERPAVHVYLRGQQQAMHPSRFNLSTMEPRDAAPAS